MRQRRWRSLGRLPFGIVLFCATVRAQPPNTESSPTAPVASDVAPIVVPKNEVKPGAAPQVSILSMTPGPKGTLVVELEVLSQSDGVVQIQPALNGQPLRTFSLSQARTLALGNRYTLTLPVQRQDGVLSLVAQSGASRSPPAVVRLRRGSPEDRPALHVLSVGVGHYQSSDIPKLRYPAKDARDLVETLKRQKDLLYREITTRVAVDGEATRAVIVDGFSWLQKSTGRRDTAVIFLAGHGTNDPDGMYYYLPVDAQTDRQSMLSGAVLQEALRGIRGRIILLLDTCHSGNVLGRSSLNRLINDLTSENRIVVFAASTGDQTARESPAWQNGAFTKAIIEGLRGVADYAEDGQISMSELETWTGVRVGQLTAGAQTPTLAKPNAAPDYILAALPLVGVLPNPKQVLKRRVLWGSIGVAAGVALIIGMAVGIRNELTQDNNVRMVTY